MALNRTRRAALRTELQVCEQRLGGLIESFNFLAGMLEASGERGQGQMVRREGLAKAQAMLDLIVALRQEMQTRLAIHSP